MFFKYMFSMELIEKRKLFNDSFNFYSHIKIYNFIKGNK